MKKLVLLLAVVIGISASAQDNSMGEEAKAIDRLFAAYEETDSLLVKNEKGQFWVKIKKEYNREGQPLSMNASFESQDTPALAEAVYEIYHKRVSEGFEAELNHPYTEDMLEREMADGWIIKLNFNRGSEHYIIKGQRSWEEPSTMMSIYEIHITFIDWDRRSGERITEFDF